MSAKVSPPMPVTISKVLVSFGEEIKFDDAIIVLEAMKMNNTICAPANGRIREIRVKEKDKVKTGQVLVVLESNNFFGSITKKETEEL